jgi:nucleotide-binding universal stress UspA family protein
MAAHLESRNDAPDATPARGVFADIVVGVDGSPEARAALQLALRLRADGARLLGFSVAEVHHALHTGIEAASWTSSIRTAADEVREETAGELEHLPNASVRAVDGRPAGVLLAAAAERQADLIAVGAGRHGRTAGLLFGSTATRIAREGPCSVLIGRTHADPDAFPQRIVVGVDGSAHAGDAAAVGQVLADSFGAQIRRIAATGGEQFDPSRPLRAELDAREPVPALVDASRDADLLIVGSRGLRGLAALGSVAERVAHRAASPVLIVRFR